MKKLFILFFFFLAISASAQNPNGIWRHFTNSNGVNCMIADGTYLWLGTDGGLVKYDRRVDTFAVLAPWNSGLPAVQVYSLLRDQQGGIWVRTFNSGWVRFFNGTWSPMNVPIDGSIAIADSAGRVWMGGGGGVGKFQNGKWTIYTDSTSPISSNTILSLCADRSGRVWILTGNQHDTIHGSLLSTDGDTYWEAHNIKSDPSFDTTRGLGSVFASRDGSIWLRTGDQYSSILYHVHASIWDTVTVRPAGGTFNSVTGMAEDATGLWICDQNGAGHFDGHTWTVLDKAAGFPFLWPRGMISDGNELWFISPNDDTNPAGFISPPGLAKFSNGKWKRYDSLSNCSLRRSHIQALTTDSKGRYWFGEADGTRISSFDGTNWTGYDSLTANGMNGINANYISALAADSSDNVWIAATKGLSKFDGVTAHSFDLGKLVPHPDSIKVSFSNNVTAIACDKHGTLWAGTIPPGWSGLAKFDGTTWTPYQMTNSPIPDINVSSIAIDKKGYVWIASPYEGIARFDGEKGWKIFNASNSAIPSNRVWKVDIAPNGDVWIATQGGAAKWDGITWTSFASDNPIAPADLSTLTADSRGNIWFGSISAYVAGGVSMFDGTNWTMFSTKNSLVGSNVIGNMIAGKNGEVWVGTMDAGVVEFIPENSSAVTKKTNVLSQFLSLSTFPNPATNIITLAYDLPKSSSVGITIYSITGERMKEIHEASIESGHHEAALDLSVFPDGTYFISLSACGVTERKVVMKISEP